MFLGFLWTSEPNIVTGCLMKPVGPWDRNQS